GHAAGALEEALGPGAAGIVAIPVEGGGGQKALRGLEAERMDVADDDDEAGKVLARLGKAELAGLLDGVDGVGASIGQPDDLGAGGLRLKKEGREVGGSERVVDAAGDLAAAGLDHARQLGRHLVAERVV